MGILLFKNPQTAFFLISCFRTLPLLFGQPPGQPRFPTMIRSGCPRRPAESQKYPEKGALVRSGTQTASAGNQWVRGIAEDGWRRL